MQHIAETEDSEDPLEAWAVYVSWARQALLNGGQKGEFATILNDCVRKFSSKKFKDNYKYVRICTEFVDFCNSPIDFMKWMEKSEIGVCYSLFWETKARILEDVARDVKGANAALSEGINKNAQPVSRLVAKRKELQARVAAKMNKSEEDEEEQIPGRVAFGALKSGSSARSARGGPGKLKVTEENPRIRTQFRVLDAGAEDTLDSGRDWIDFGSQREAIKENTDVAKQWSKVKVPQKQQMVKSVSRPKFEIFGDDDEGEGFADAVVYEEDPKPVKNEKKKSSSSKPAFAVFDEEDNIKKPVLRAASKKASSKAVSSSTKGLTITKGKEQAGFDEEMLENQTLSFEEVRARTWMKKEAEFQEARQREAEREALEAKRREEEEEVRRAREEFQKVMRDAKSTSTKRDMTSSNMNVSTRNHQISFAVDMSRCLDESMMDTMNYERLVRAAAKTTNLDAIDDIRNVYDDTIDMERQMSAPGNKSLFREPTLNTKAVMEEVEKMFNEHLSLNNSSVVDATPAPIDTTPASIMAPRTALASKPTPSASSAPFTIFEDSFNEVSMNTKQKMQQPMSPISEEQRSNGSEELKVIVNSNPWDLDNLAPFKLSQIKGYVQHKSSKAECDGKYLELGDNVYDLSVQIGGGVESNVFLAELVSGDEEEASCVVKMVKPANPWEFYISSKLLGRCSESSERSKFPKILSYHQFREESILFSSYHENGTMASLLDLWKKEGGVPEPLVLLYASKLLELLQLMHSKKILHNDISPENIMLHEDGGLILVDFSCAIDIEEMDPRTAFKGNGRCSISCLEMQAREPWTFQQDFYGVANIIHCLIFGSALETERITNKHEIKTQFNQNWHVKLWEDIFSNLLNQKMVSLTGHFEDAVILSKLLQDKIDLEKEKHSKEIKKLVAKQNIMLFENK